MGLSSRFVFEQPHSEASAGALQIARLASQEVEHGHCPDIRKVFCAPPDNQA